MRKERPRRRSAACRSFLIAGFSVVRATLGSIRVLAVLPLSCLSPSPADSRASPRLSEGNGGDEDAANRSPPPYDVAPGRVRSPEGPIGCAKGALMASAYHNWHAPGALRVRGCPGLIRERRACRACPALLLMVLEVNQHGQRRWQILVYHVSWALSIGVLDFHAQVVVQFGFWYLVFTKPSLGEEFQG